MVNKDYSKQDFIRFWGEEGYLETWDGDVFIKKHFDNAERILDFRHALFLVKKT
jgi:hypothetical protein